MPDHRSLEVYDRARELRRLLVRITPDRPRGQPEVADQMHRASLSVKLNIAEGAAEYSPKEKARFYRMAKRSAGECGALIDDLIDLEVLTPEQGAPAHALVERIIGSLVRLIQSMGARAQPP